MDAKTVAILVSCLATVVGALAYVARTQAKTAEKNASAQMGLVEKLAVAHASNVENRLSQLVISAAETVTAVRENTAAVNLLVSRFDGPPPSGGVVTETSEDETPPLGIVKPLARKPTSVYQFQRRGIGDKK